jgi:hypothetical protein
MLPCRRRNWRYWLLLLGKFAIPPPALSGSGSRVEGHNALLSAWFYQAPRAKYYPDDD